jgi:hypothetical protein
MVKIVPRADRLLCQSCGYPLNLTRVELPSRVIRHFLQCLVAKSRAQRNIQTRIIVIIRDSQAKFYP